ncbi:MAG: ribosome rescue protein RqcH [Thermoplasmata archaeon]|nr:ribosome rescue protein RqcH [Thermoplasmata archaeon]
MKKALSSFDVGAIVRELQTYIDWRVDKIYQPNNRHIVISIKSPGEGKAFLHFRVGEWLYVSKEGQDMPQHPSDFAMMLRKRVTNCRVAGIEQQGFDRIVVVRLEKDDVHQLVLELFGKGNAILVKDGMIVQPLTSRTWRHRDVKAKREFEFPPPVPDPSSMPLEDLLDILKGSESDVLRTLATKLNLGGTYSEEICERAHVDRERPAQDISKEEAMELMAAVNEIIEDIRSENRGYVVTKEGELVDAVPLRMAIYDGYEHREFEAFSECVRNYVESIPESVKTVDKKANQGELDRLKRKLAQQEEAALDLQREWKKAQAEGDAVFVSYGDIAHILLTAKDHLSQSKGLTDLPGFVSFDRKSAKLRIDVGEATYDLDVNGTVESNAQRYYEKSKKLKAKLEGVLPALEDTRAAIAEWDRERKAAIEQSTASDVKPTKRFWFERYRWFVSSEGAIVLGGKDARTNDMLVKKHLKTGDRYAHADIHGAPSVVVKMAEGVGEQTLAEACKFAVATSKAWNAKLGTGVGYWVLPEQVSKSPQSGEFLARGAFVIRGKRNYSDKAEIMLGLGEVEFEGERKIMCGPVEAVKARGKRYALIRPGAIDKNAFAKAAARAFHVPIEEVQRVLPPGNIDIVESFGVELRL